MSQDYNQPGPPPPPYPGPPAPPAYNPYAYGGAPPPSGGGGGTFPWEDRARLGFVPALIETIKLVVTQPAEAFSRLQPNGDLTSPLLFGIIVGWPAALVATVWNVLFSGLMVGMPGGGGQLSGMQMGLSLVFYPVFYLIGAFIVAGVVHLALMAFKGLEGSNFGFEGTLKVFCYSSLALLAQIVPIIGGFIGLAALAVLMVFGVRSVHRTSTQTAALAVVVPFVLCCVCVVGGAMMFAAAIAAALQGGG